MTFFDEDNASSAMRNGYAREEGSLRIRYKGLLKEQYSKIAVVGKQQGNWIVKDDRIDSMTAWKNVGDKESLKRKVPSMSSRERFFPALHAASCCDLASCGCSIWTN